jgi:hypothetical protein
MSFDFGSFLSGLGDNLKANMGGLQTMPLGQKLMTAGAMAQGVSPAWLAMMHQYGGQGGGQAASPSPTVQAPDFGAGLANQANAMRSRFASGFGFGNY